MRHIPEICVLIGLMVGFANYTYLYSCLVTLKEPRYTAKTIGWQLLLFATLTAIGLAAR